MTIEEAVEIWPPLFVGSYLGDDIIDRSLSVLVLKDSYSRTDNIVIAADSFGLTSSGVITPRPLYHAAVLNALRGAIGKTVEEAGLITVSLP